MRSTRHRGTGGALGAVRRGASGPVWWGALVALAMVLGVGCSRDGRDMQPPSGQPAVSAPVATPTTPA